MKYTKPPLTFNEQISLLKSRNLIISDVQSTNDLLQRISYYRLSAYFLPLQKSKDVFKPDVTIENVNKPPHFPHNCLTAVSVELLTQTWGLYHEKYPTSFLIHLSHLMIRTCHHTGYATYC